MDALNMLAKSNIAGIFVEAISDFNNVENELNKKIQEKEQGVSSIIEKF